MCIPSALAKIVRITAVKVRNGFVSNSSSASFVIAKKHLSPCQICAIKNYIDVGKELNMLYPGGWFIEDTDTHIRGSTDMDNFDMFHLLREIGVPNDVIGRTDGHWMGPEDAQWTYR